MLLEVKVSSLLRRAEVRWSGKRENNVVGNLFYCGRKSPHLASFCYWTLMQLTEKLNHHFKLKCFFLWLLFITSDLSCIFPCSSCTLVTLQSLESFPRNHRISIYHMWASPSFRLGERLLLNHLMVKQWTAIFSPPSRGTVAFTYSYFRCDEAFGSAKWFLISVKGGMNKSQYQDE